MEAQLPEPGKQISKDAVKVWMISSFIGNCVGLLLLGGLIWAAGRYGWYPWIGLVFKMIFVFLVLYLPYDVWIEPIYRQKTWRYEIHDQFIQLKFGVLEKNHFLIPMTKIQYVNLRQGLLLRKYGLADITVKTMASEHEIPGLPLEEAKQLRMQIAKLAAIAEEEEALGIDGKRPVDEIAAAENGEGEAVPAAFQKPAEETAAPERKDKERTEGDTDAADSALPSGGGDAEDVRHG